MSNVNKLKYILTSDRNVYVKSELREMPQEGLALFLDDFNHHIFDMVSSSDASEEEGGVLAISKLSKRLKKILYIHLTSNSFILFVFL